VAKTTATATTPHPATRTIPSLKLEENMAYPLRCVFDRAEAKCSILEVDKRGGR
jgi:hypothetical protein